MNSSFHLALPCTNIKDTIDFYSNILKADKGRSAITWVDIGLYGNQLTFTQTGEYHFQYKSYNFENTVLPSFHFGVLLKEQDWTDLLNHVKQENRLEISPTIFLEDRPGEHKSFFVRDPNNYLVEFKKFKNVDEVFSS